jgi:3-carboxy-cis,cis-muconate cycloisomerase
VNALNEHRSKSLVLQFGGAAGTLAALGEAGMNVAQRLAGELNLQLPDLPWHAERDRIAAIASAVGVAAGAMAKIANDVVLLAQTEVAEVSEASEPGKGGSSAMPQKKNPVDAMMALASAKLATGIVPVILSAMSNEHERAAGGWQAEWVAIPNLFRHTSSAVNRVRSLLAGLQVDSDRMKQNLEAGGGMLMAESLTIALAAHIGRPEAEKLVKLACSRAAGNGSSLKQAALEDPHILAKLSNEAVERALEPSSYFGMAGVMIDRALDGYHKAKAGVEAA